jgi:hypothetical protein
VRAKDSKQSQAYKLKPINVQKVQYEKSETKRAITNVLDAVLNSYKYSSLPELNAVLQQYNVTADRGNDTSRVYNNNGLTYRIIDENGNKIGVPIKASDFYNKPTLKYLQEKFNVNETSKQPNKVRVKNSIDLALLKNANHSIQSLVKALEKDGINTVLRQNNEGIIYGITYVDHRTKSVFNGSDLGKQYCANGIQERCKQVRQLQSDETTKQQLTKKQETQNQGMEKEQNLPVEQAAQQNIPKALDDLSQPSQVNNYLPHQLKKSKKKKRKNISNNL